MYKTDKAISKLQGSFMYFPINIPDDVIKNAIIQLTRSLDSNFLVNFRNVQRKILTRNRHGRNQAEPIEVLNFKTFRPEAYSIINKLSRNLRLVILKKTSFQSNAGSKSLLADVKSSSLKLSQYFEKSKK